MKRRQGIERPSSPIPFNHVFGDDPFRYALPLIPIFNDPEAVFRYRTEGDAYIT